MSPAFRFSSPEPPTFHMQRWVISHVSSIVCISWGMQSQPEACWDARHPVDGSELGPFTTDAVAASALDKVLGVKSTDLARGHQSAVPRSASNFKYVTSKVRRDGTQHWVAQPTACRVAAPGRHSTRCGPVGCLLQVTIDRRPKTWHILSVQLQVRGRLSRSTV